MNAELETRYAEVVRKVAGYLPTPDLRLLRESLEYADDKHEGQTRKSGEPYIGHPIEVAHIVADLHLDLASIAAAFLHDTVEDTDATLDEITTAFGGDIAMLVEGLTKISKLQFKSREEAQAENIRKLIIAMGRDIRVILIKLSDRLHNLRTLEHMAEAKQRRIAQETLDIYAPLANRLGINWMKTELEDTSFRYLNHSAYYSLAKHIDRTRRERETYIRETSALLRKLCGEHGIEAEIQGRPKHFYSIYKKMQNAGVDLDDIHDITAFRVIVPEEALCYTVLGVVHAEWKPVAGRFKDYIAVPKPNGYRSLHTTVLGPQGERIEIQIRTLEMHHVAEHGVAAHWAYKEGKANVEAGEAQFAWLRDMVQSQRDIADSRELLDTVRHDLFADEVFVFTPAGDVINLPSGATPLDFAYAVHSEVGDRAVHARVNGRGVSLRHELNTGDRVEITTRPEQHPREEWLDFVKSGKARSKIRQYIRAEKREKARELGREWLGAEFKRYGLRYDNVLKSGDLQAAAEILKVQTVDQLLIAVGYGKIAKETVAEKIAPPETTPKDPKMGPVRKIGEHLRSLVGRPRERGVKLAGLDGEVMVRYAKCCTPVPGDDIVGFVTRGRGIVVHTQDCSRLANLEEERIVEVVWDSLGEGEGSKRSVTVRVLSKDEPGILGEISSAFATRGVNIAQAHCRSREDGLAMSVFEIHVANASQLKDASRAVSKLDGVINVERAAS